VTTADLRALYPQYSWELKLRYMLIGDLQTAERVRLDLMRGRTTWAAAARRYSLLPDSLAHGEVGWLNRTGVTGAETSKIFGLQPPGISEPVKDRDGYRIWQCLDRRPATPPPFAGVKLSLAQEVRAAREGPLRDSLFAEAGVLAQARFDTANIAWLADRFARLNRVDSNQPALDLTAPVPSLAPEDTGRVLAYVRGKPFSMGQMIALYRSVHGLFRRKVLGFMTMMDMVQRMTLEPEVVTLARRAGFDTTAAVTKLLDSRREGLLVDQMYTDSVSAHVRVTEPMRRKVYEQYKANFVAPEKARYIMIIRGSEAGADSVLARLAKGVPATQIALEDSLAGMRYGATREESESDAGAYRDILFGELKPGESSKLGRTGGWIVFCLLGRVPARPQPYEEVADTVDQAAEAVESERLFAEWVGRLRKRYGIEAHPERLMLFTMVQKSLASVVPTD
jgi:hypothetical protein